MVIFIFLSNEYLEPLRFRDTLTDWRAGLTGTNGIQSGECSSMYPRKNNPAPAHAESHPTGGRSAENDLESWWT